MRRSQRRSLVLIAMLLASGCGGGGEGPVAPPPGSGPPGTVPPPSPNPNAGVLTVSFATPHADDAGVLVTITSNQHIDSIAAVGGYEVYSEQFGVGGRAVVIGGIKSGDLFKVYVSNPVGRPEYHLVMEQIANAAYELRTNLDGYTISIH